MMEREYLLELHISINRAISGIDDDEWTNQDVKDELYQALDYLKKAGYSPNTHDFKLGMIRSGMIIEED